MHIVPGASAMLNHNQPVKQKNRTMLRHRLLFGTLMIILFVGLVILDAWWDGSITDSSSNKPVQATILVILILLVGIFANLEFAFLAAKTGAKIFLPLTIACSIALSTTWYWGQTCSGLTESMLFRFGYILFVICFSVVGLFIYQAGRFGTDGVIKNCGANLLAVFYLGFLSSFIVALRVEFGPWELLMFIFTVKSSDTGAYTAGKLFGKHKFAPNISPGKTWEGMAGAAIFASVVALLFACFCGIMIWPAAVLFGIVFAFFGQLADLIESMIKRDAGVKDSAKNVPGFGGVLDIIDSLLATAPAAYLFFLLLSEGR
jgi:phosphatidate cytidylyltransferase